ncbi:FAD-binding molybdopterin dehydrogenase [Defluviimonas sp. 20V17]|uniref:FAD-binding molybdopterin dehydrogenase n=1 Tax=Allgaiera indica TaxID=765699 RepID=A0AAN4URW9_9RHOB|nr:xanthine dehydrogenase family protein subunit M [Allgaiera indica]KDB02212.1 FAD-binding molybdopterin dehydrogenase [Defluviimonas sp. 20V17]GHE02728.1 FAD-binding molybdopterin dehydrogenase [Allgaiera indica]SDX18612.1 xanthine dehydrogenase YagS FAD-binding subunit [Allgaiera indica]
MKPFDYIRAESLDQALAEGGKPGTAYLAGGTNLLDLMKTGAARPERLVDITRLPGLDRWEWQDDGGLRIGAMVRNSDLAHDPDIAATFPAMAEALLSGASGQLRNAATTGGNVMQHTRCHFFADPASPCNRRAPGTGCAAQGGDRRGFAVLGGSDACIATHPSDLCVALAALDAVVEIAGPEGLRETPLADFHLLPGTRPEAHTQLAPGELIVAIRLPAAAAGFRHHARYLKLRDRTSFAFALVSAAAMLRIENGVIAEARLAFGGIAPRPWRSPLAEAALKGARPDAESFALAAEAALAGAAGHDAKIALAKRLAARALTHAAQGTPERVPALPGSVHRGETAHV